MRLLTVLWIVVKQMVRNWRLELGLLLGLVMAVAIASAVPIYTNGALQYSFMRDWMRSTSKGRLPFTLFIMHDPGMDGKVDLERFQRLEEFLEQNRSDPNATYEALKVYLLLTGYPRRDKWLVMAWMRADCDFASTSSTLSRCFRSIVTTPR